MLHPRGTVFVTGDSSEDMLPDECRLATSKIRCSHTVTSLIPRDAGPRKELGEQGRAANRWPFGLSSEGYRY